MLYLVKPDLIYFEQYNEMMKEWNESNTQIAPWFLDKPFERIEEFAKFIKMLDNVENGIVDENFSSSTSYFVIDENGKIIGAKCNGVLENVINDPNELDETINRYWIDNI